MAKTRPTRSTNGAACPQFSELIDQFAFCKSIDDLPALRNEILSNIPDAVELYRSIADPGAVDAVFESLRQKLDEGLSQDRNTRSMALRTPLGRIAQWERTVAGIDRLQHLLKAEGDAITTFVRFANTAFHLADDVLAWFPDPDSTGRETGWATAPERESLAQIVSPGGVIAFHDTLYARAVASARERGEPAFALPKLERIQKGLSRLGQLLRDGSATSLIGTDVGQELGEAICDAHVLIERKPATPGILTADEVVKKVGRDWATVAELSQHSGQSQSVIRSKIARAREGILPPDTMWLNSLCAQYITDPGPGMPRIEYHILRVWPILTANVRRKSTRGKQGQ